MKITVHISEVFTLVLIEWRNPEVLVCAGHHLQDLNVHFYEN
jgi:hypothetical protein